MERRTVDGEVTERGAGGTLHLNVWVLKQEQNGLEGLAVDFSDICMQLLAPGVGQRAGRSTSFCDFGKGQAGGTLQIDVV